MSAAIGPAPEGLVHVGMRYGSAESFVAGALPLVRGALDRGDAVSTLLDRRTARALREAAASTGPVDRLTDRSPHEFGGHSFDQMRLVPHWIEPDRRTFVVGQYADGLSAGDCRVIEDGINLLFAGLPLTVVCACADVDDTDLVDAWHQGHPTLLDGALEPNAGFRTPVDRTPVPAAVWGECAVSMSLSDVADLAQVRDEVARAAGAAGLHGDDADAAVLAVHEAAMLAVRSPGEGRLEVRASPQGVFSEIRSGAGPLEVGALRFVDLFSAATTVGDDDGARVLRVLSRP